jgi:hypothetical protein
MRDKTNMRSHRFLAVWIAAALVVAACGGSTRGGSLAPDSGVVDSSMPIVDAAAATDTGPEAAPPSEAGEVGDAFDGGPMCSQLVADASSGPQWCAVWPPPISNMVSGSAIYGFAANNIWAVADGGLILHYDGTSWSHQAVGTYDLNAIWGAAANDIWIVGDGGTLLHYDGTSWSKVVTNTQVSLGWIWGSSSSNVWLIGDQGTVMHYAGPDAGTGWVSVDVPIPTLYPDGGLGPVGDGDTPIDLGGVWTDGPNDVWIVGDAGVVVHWDGTSWTLTPTNLPTYLGLSGIWGTASTNIWVAGDCKLTGTACTGGTLLHWDGTSWTQWPNFPGQYDLAGLWGFNANDIWITSDYGNLFHYDGTAWTQSPTPTTTVSWNSVWGADPQHVWVIGDLGLILEEKP